MWLFFIVSLCTTFHVVTAFCQLHNKRICYVMLWLFWWIKSAKEIGILHWRQIAFSRCSYIDDCWCCEGGEQADWPQAWRCVPQVIVCRQKTTQPVTFRFLSVGSFFSFTVWNAMKLPHYRSCVWQCIFIVLNVLHLSSTFKYIFVGVFGLHFQCSSTT